MQGGAPLWTCGWNGCSEMNFTLGMGAITHSNITGNITSSAESKPTNATVAEIPHTKEHSATVVGAAVGVSLGVLLLLALGYIVFLLRKRHAPLRRDPVTRSSPDYERQTLQPSTQAELSDRNWRAELHDDRPVRM